MPDAYVIEVSGRTAGIVARDPHSNSFNFFSAAPRFNAIEGQRFSDPMAAERAARKLAKYGNLPRCRETEYSRPAQVKQLRTAKAEKVFKETARITTDSAYPIVTHFFTAIFLDELVPKIEK